MQIKYKFYKTKLTFLIIWSLIILYFSINRAYGPSSGIQTFLIPGFLHIFAYFIFAFLLFFILTDDKLKNIFLATVLIAFIYGFGMEIIQTILPWRNFSFIDSFYNLIGSSLVLLLKPFQHIL